MLDVRWTDFFIAEVGATAALAGLIIVAISINLQRILTTPHLPGRAFEALALLIGALLICSVVLIPGQPLQALGCEILAIECLVLMISVRQQFGTFRADDQQLSWIVSRVLIIVATAGPVLVGGVLLALGDVSGLYWVAPGVLLAIVASVLNTWILLIEILR